MSSFTDPLTVTDLGNGKWKVERSFRYYVGEENSTDFVDVPIDYETDFFSIPIVFRWLLPKTQQGNQSSVLHDFLYTTRGENGKRTRKECDDIFLEAMEVLNVSWIKRRTMYTAVRVGGGFAW